MSVVKKLVDKVIRIVGKGHCRLFDRVNLGDIAAFAAVSACFIIEKPLRNRGHSMVGDIGFEPITSTTSMWRSSQMS